MNQKILFWQLLIALKNIRLQLSTIFFVEHHRLLCNRCDVRTDNLHAISEENLYTDIHTSQNKADEPI